MPLTLLNWMLAFFPVIVVLALMLGLKWGGGRAGAVSWLAAIGVAVMRFGASPSLIAYTQVKAVLLTLDVIYIVWTALILFHIADEAGAVRAIGQALPRLTSDRMMLGLLLGWLFASFLQGMGGFGVPVAVSAPLLVGLGFSPVQAVVMACIGHGWAVNFGSLAISFQTLLAVTGLPGKLLAPDAALLLGLASFACGGIVAYICAGWRGLARSLPAVFILGGLMSAVQYALVTHGLWTLGATGAAMAGLAGGIVLARLPMYRCEAALASSAQSRTREAVTIPERTAEAVTTPVETAETVSPPAPLLHPAVLSRGSPAPLPPNSPSSLIPPTPALPIALSAYIVLVLLAFAANLIPPVRAVLNSVHFTLAFPELSTRYGYITPAGDGRLINLFGHPGAILLYASLISYWIYARAGAYRPGAASRILAKVAAGAIPSSLAIFAMVGMAEVMAHSGMTDLLANGLSQGLGRGFYPLVTPFIGALGAFITGSNNNSNVLFAVLQKRTAELLGLSIPLILGSQTAGGSLGSIMAPAKVIVGCSTVGLSDREAAVMGKVIAYGLVPIALVALATWITAR